MTRKIKGTPKIAFMTTLGVNVGDDFIREGICSFLDELFESWDPLYVNKHDMSSLFHPRENERILLKDKFCEADIIIQAGAPVYWKIGNSTSYNVDWAEELWEKRIFQLGPLKPIFNIAGGSCQPYYDFAKTFLSDPACVQFAKNAYVACRWTSVRDPLASQILFALRLDHEVLPCTAFHGPRRLHNINNDEKYLGVNLMPYAGHYKLSEDIDERRWDNIIKAFLFEVRKRHTLLFIAHDEIERKFMEQYLSGDEVVFCSYRWQDYANVYQKCKVVIANRVHGAVYAAGLGKPALIVGNDSRLLIGDYIGIPALYISEIESEELVEFLEKAIYMKRQEKDRLLTLREETAKRYCEGIREGLENPKRKACYSEEEKNFSLISYSEMSSSSFRGFMKTLNCFSKRWGLQEYTEDPETWTFPWAWFNGLSKIDWNNTNILSVDDQMNPLPWFLASLGVDVSVVGSEGHWAYQLQKISDKTGLNVNWRFASNGTIPFEKETFDVVISLTLTNPVEKDISNIEEMIRVLKPGGSLVYSFSIQGSENEMDSSKRDGITFTRSQFEKTIWNHPAVDTYGMIPKWDVERNAYSKQTQEKSSASKPLVGCVILRKNHVK